MARVIGSWPRRLTIAAAFAIALIATALGLFSAEILRELNNLRESPRDNEQWSLAQVEVEQLIFADAVNQARFGRVGLDEVRQRFDILYSRAGILKHSDVFALLRDKERGAAAITEFHRRLDDLIPVIDSPDEALAAALPALADEAATLRPVIRQIALDGLKLFAARSDERRAAFSRLIMETAAVALVLIVLLIIVVLLVLQQKRVSMDRARALQLSAQRFRSTIEASLNAVIISDEDGRIVHFNKAAEGTFGFPREKVVGTDLAELMIPTRHRKAHKAGMARFKTTGEAHVIGRGRVELAALHASGREFPVELSLSAIDGPEGRLFIAFARDITDRVEAERALTEARDKALAAAKAKSDFLAVMSHEMRTPLNGVMALLDLLGETELEPQQRRLVETAVASGELLQHHVDDVLDINRMKAGLLSLDPRPADVHALVDEIVRMNRPAAEARHNAISARVDLPHLPLLVDRRRLGQVLLNLVANAVKFTEGGKIEVAVGSTTVEGRDVLEIAVSDTGIGIAEADRSRIFEDFVTLDPSYRRSAGGYGLGLGICRRIVDAMDGTIAVESEVGAGSRFTVRVPLVRAQEAEEPPAPLPAPEAAVDTDAVAPSGQHPLGVLLVDDNETNRFAAREMLRSEGCVVVEAADGLAGLSMAERCRFDLILMDISMPRLDGIEAARRIRAGDGLSKNAPIVALTAHAQPEERLRTREAGMDDLLIKPLRRQLIACLIRRVRAGVLAGAPPETGPCADGAPARARDPFGDIDDEIVDRAVLAELADLVEPHELARRIDVFRNELASLADDLAETWARGELEPVRARAHRTNGSAGLFGAVRLTDVLATLEEACIDGEEEFVTPLVAEARRAAEETDAALAAFGSHVVEIRTSALETEPACG